MIKVGFGFPLSPRSRSVFAGRRCSSQFCSAVFPRGSSVRWGEKIFGQNMTLVTFRGALLIFRFCYGQFEETTLYWPSGRHRFSASVIPSVPLFVGPSMASVFGPVNSAHFVLVTRSGILWHR